VTHAPDETVLGRGVWTHRGGGSSGVQAAVQQPRDRAVALREVPENQRVLPKHYRRRDEDDAAIARRSGARQHRAAPRILSAGSDPADDHRWRWLPEVAWPPNFQHDPCDGSHKLVRCFAEIFDRLRLLIYDSRVQSINERLYASHNQLAERGIQSRSLVVASLACHTASPWVDSDASCIGERINTQ
jgi:hypothetical protein